jgi:DNA processing protein
MMDGEQDAGYWIALSKIPGIGPARLRRLWEYFGDMAAAWKADAHALRIAGLDGRSVEALSQHRGALHPDREAQRLADSAAGLLTLADAAFPALLRPLEGAPALLYVRGTLQPEDEAAVAVVGNRQITPYGRQVTHHFVSDLAVHHITIVSGLARGVDALAHTIALERGTRTIAVLGCGVDQIYPPEHRALAGEITRAGALVSEFPLGTLPDAGNFPLRNRVISGLSLGTLIIEAGPTSGALITAQRALEQNRDVFAVPGSIFAPRSAGTNALIRRGEARLVTCAAQLLEELQLDEVPRQLGLEPLLAHDATEAHLLSYLGAEPLHVDALTRLVDLPVNVVSAALAMLELRGMVRQVSTMLYVRAR